MGVKARGPAHIVVVVADDEKTCGVRAFKFWWSGIFSP